MINKKLMYGLKGQDALALSADEAFKEAKKIAFEHGELKYPITIYEYAPMKVVLDERCLLALLLKEIDIEYCHPDVENTKYTPTMLKHTKKYLKKLYQNIPFLCMKRLAIFMNTMKMDWQTLWEQG